MRFQNAEATYVKELIFVLRGDHDGQAGFEYVHVKTPFSNLESSYYWANTTAGRLEFYYSKLGIIDVYKLPMILNQILYVKA